MLIHFPKHSDIGSQSTSNITAFIDLGNSNGIQIFTLTNSATARKSSHGSHGSSKSTVLTRISGGMPNPLARTGIYGLWFCNRKRFPLESIPKDVAYSSKVQSFDQCY
ncbi:Hypothetical predicted protein [Mytilus galloprovincialis]|nr:Hypothetical predicted protein [Mytilus galloprovincialis]